MSASSSKSLQLFGSGRTSMNILNISIIHCYSHSWLQKQSVISGRNQEISNFALENKGILSISRINIEVELMFE